jgi:hypothetical protein
MLKLLSASRHHPYLPGLENPQLIRVNLSGSRFEFQVPAYLDIRTVEKLNPIDLRLDIHNLRYFSRASPDFCSATLFNRDLDFYSTLCGVKSIGTIGVVAMVERVDCLSNGMNCLNPAHFEQVVMRLLHRLGPGNPGFWKKIAPVNWRVFCRGDSTWINCEMRNDIDAILKPTPYDNMQFTSFAITALDERHILRVMHNTLGYAPEPFVQKVRGQICRSVKLTLSDEVKARMAAVKARWPNAKVSEFREPEQWTYPKWRKGHADLGEPNIVVSKLGSPPPELKL